MIPSSTNPEHINDAKKYLSNFSILVTGGGGSIGSELVSQLYQINVKKIYVVDNSEYNLFKIQEKIKLLNSPDITTEVVYLLKDISDEGIVKNLIKEKIDGVFHAAAYKHVDLVEKMYFLVLKIIFLPVIIYANILIKKI